MIFLFYHKNKNQESRSHSESPQSVPYKEFDLTQKVLTFWVASKVWYVLPKADFTLFRASILKFLFVEDTLLIQTFYFDEKSREV